MKEAELSEMAPTYNSSIQRLRQDDHWLSQTVVWGCSSVSLACTRPWFDSLALNKLDVVANAYSASIREIERSRKISSSRSFLDTYRVQSQVVPHEATLKSKTK